MQGNEEEAEIRRRVSEILKGFEPQRGALLPILQRIQAGLGYVPVAAMEMVGRFLGIPTGEVFGVATFYNQFRLHPPGKYQIKVCMGTACHVKRSPIILDEWKRRLNIDEGQTTPDRLFSLERVACVGCCALAPVTVVTTDGKETFFGHMMTTKVNGIIMQLRGSNRHECGQSGDGEIRGHQG
jgi:NADH-quinone oxidoreductase subunit E